MSDLLKWFVDTNNKGYIEFLCFLPVGYDAELELPSLVWPKILKCDTNYVELVDVRGNVHMVKMDRDDDYSAWSFNGSGWVSFISTFKDLNPKMIHFEQIDLNTFLVNFYTKDGDEIDYVFTKDHDQKCVVVGCHDPRMYQPIPHKMLLNSKLNHDRKCVRIAFNGVEVELEVSFSVCSKSKTRVGVAFTGLEWERLCNTVMFSASKAIIISSDESGGSFVGKVINGFVAAMKFDSATGEYSNVGGVSEKTFVYVFSSVSRLLFIVIKCGVVIVMFGSLPELVGDMHRLKEILELKVGDRMLFEHVSGNISSDAPLFFNVSKLV
ncbi:hypothetical protein Tco_0375083 [Tanacetum coccineum]